MVLSTFMFLLRLLGIIVRILITAPQRSSQLRSPRKNNDKNQNKADQ